MSTARAGSGQILLNHQKGITDAVISLYWKKKNTNISKDQKMIQYEKKSSLEKQNVKH